VKQPRLVDWAAPAPSELAWRRSSGAWAEVEEFNEGARAIELDAELDAVRRPEPRSAVFRVVTKETYTFDMGAGGAGLIVPLTDLISAVGYRRCVLQVRVHEIVAIQGACQAYVYVEGASRDPRDPTTLLLQKGPYASCSLTSTTPAPGLLVDGSLDELPESFRVVMEWVPSSPGTSTFTIGVDLVLRE
jgi:hypothetical protein